MQLQNLECQIAKAQIGRHVSGDRLSPETLAQLEEHIAKCPDCKQNLAERRAVLQAMLPTAPQPKPEPKVETVSAKASFVELLKSKMQTAQPVEAVVENAPIPSPAPKIGKSNFTKPMMYSLALCAVLITMSYASRNLGALTGPKVANSPEASPKPKANPAPRPTPNLSLALFGGARGFATSSTAPAVAPVVEPPAAPAPEAPQPARRVERKPAAHTKLRHSHHAKPSGDTVRVYDPN